MKFILSKNQWVKAGKKAGWFKMAQGEVVEMDGKWYNDKMEEVPNPTASNPISSLPKSITVLGITFTEGEELENWFGSYQILRLLDDKFMEVQYLSAFRPDVRPGEIKRYPILAQAETIRNAMKQSELEIARATKLNKIDNFTEPNQFFTLGYIAAHGYISAEIGPKFHQRFPLTFKRITGESPDIYLGKGYQLSDNGNRWSYTLRIRFDPPPPNVGEKLKLPENRIVRETGVEINDGAFIWGLFKMGFRPGKNNARFSIILSNVPAHSQDMFIAGSNI